MRNPQRLRESKILGRGEEGFGLLIETDAGYVDKTMNKELFDRILNESFEIKPNQPILINCILQKWGVKNKNGRIYPEEVLVPEVQKYMELVEMNSAISEADHPESSVVSLLNVAHRITKMWWGQGQDRNILYGTLEIITSPAYMRDGIVCMIGDNIVEYLKRGIRLGISSRGVGTLKEIRGENIVQDDFELICFDLVASPSTPGAYLFPEISKSFAENEKKSGSIIVENEKHKKIITSIEKFLL
jgi:hypothetical protein